MPLDLTKPKNVMVFDIGSGTLDITLHRIGRNTTDSMVFDIQPLAINRYCAVAGDTFDAYLSEHLFSIYVSDLRQSDNGQALSQAVQRDKEMNMKYLKLWAEQLKIDVSHTYEGISSGQGTFSRDMVIQCGGDMPNGYSCDSDITVAAFEECLRPLLGNHLSFEDYQRFPYLKEEENIIYPILGVLHKASQKVGREALKVDAVILNGGMSQLYLIEERLKRFFGLQSIKVSDPDQSVAQGAAVYHYHRQRDHALYSKHKTFMEQAERSVVDVQPVLFQNVSRQSRSIHTVSNILNESLYLSMRAGASYLLAESGVELPYHSDMISGFSVAEGQSSLCIPIQQKDKTGVLRTIARSIVSLPGAHTNERAVSLQFSIHSNGIMDFQTYVEGKSIGQMALTLGEEQVQGKRGAKLLPPQGTKLNVKNEMSAFAQSLAQMRNPKKAPKRKALEQKISSMKQRIRSCGNPADFAEPMLHLLGKNTSAVARIHLLPVARHICQHWTDAQRKRLTKLCLEALESLLQGFPQKGQEVTANIALIYTIGVSGSLEDVKKLYPLMCEKSYREALLHVFGHMGIQQDWILSQVQYDIAHNASYQNSLRALGLSVYRNSSRTLAQEIDVNEAVKLCTHLIQEGKCSNDHLNIALVTLGFLCVEEQGLVTAKMRQEAVQVLEHLAQYYKLDLLTKAHRSKNIAMRLLEGKMLEEEDEQYLLGFLSKQDES